MYYVCMQLGLRQSSAVIVEKDVISCPAALLMRLGAGQEKTKILQILIYAYLDAELWMLLAI